MNLENLTSLDQIEGFINGTQAVAFAVADSKHERYKFVEHVLVKHSYPQLSKHDKGVIRRFIIKVSGYSRQQVTRLIKQYINHGKISFSHCTANGFQCHYTKDDARLLARTDEIHSVRNGAAIKNICERAYQIYGQTEYERLANISVSHLYNLRQSKSYQNVRRHFEKTKSRKSAIGIRKKPNPFGSPGYLRIDTVHQGDLDGVKGVYHINAVDEVTQFEVVASVEKISEAYLIPVLEKLIAQFPFKIISMHSDNGSEYINHSVVTLLNKLFIELTKSRPRHSNDNALAESKNCSIVRQILGYIHLPQHTAPMINQFNEKYLYEYINYHRPCLFPVITTNNKGKQIKKYPYKNMMTPYEKLKSLPNAEQYLKEGISLDELDQKANEMNDNQSAKLLQSERDNLFKKIFEQSRICA